MTLKERFFRYYLPVFLWMAVIFYLSSLPNLRYQMAGISLEVFLRKFAHFLEYTGLAFLLVRVFFLERKFSEKKSFILSFLVLAFFALSDEWHQTFVIGRSGKVIDATYDMLSGLVCLQFFFFGKNINLKKIFWLFCWIGGLVFLEVWMVRQAKQYQEEKNATNKQIISEMSKTKEKVNAKKEVMEKDESNKNISSKSVTDLQTEKTSVEKTTILPEKIFLDIPFTSQAPMGIWDEYHEEACEEASLLMLAYFLQGKKLNKELAEKELQAMKDFQLKKYGNYNDSSAGQIKQLGEDYFGLKNLKVIYDFSLDELKRWLARGFPIIVPAAGRELKNPFFKTPGPLYHSLVLSGYEKGDIITNDPGTKRGEGYRYPEKILFLAIHDFPGDKEKIGLGRRAMIVVEN